MRSTLVMLLSTMATSTLVRSMRKRLRACPVRLDRAGWNME